MASSSALIITAPPGAGKSTLLPLTMLRELPEGKILMLEPRRLAARQVAERMAFMLGERVGETVGYRVRFETRVSARTRIEVLSEGILSRMLVSDPTLDGVAVVIFDEFHERSLVADLALALTREAQAVIRPDLKIVLMSATLDAAALSSAMQAPVVESEGRMFPVEIVRGEECDARNVAEQVAHYIRLAHREHEGDILAFLPGQGEIERCRQLLGDALGTTSVYPLYGILPPEEQRRAIAPSQPGERKVVLATPVAETSITIEGVRVVVDSGLCRTLVYEPRNGLSHLETVRISLDMATQRSGRAGRVAPGVCYRLWSLSTEHRMAEVRIPEIQDADLAPMVLDIAAWGESDPLRLPWLTAPQKAHVAQAQTLLRLLSAVDERGVITSVGKRMAQLPCHPRIARMLLSAETPEQKALAADIAALLEEKDPMAAEPSADINLRIGELRRLRAAHRLGRWERIARIAQEYRTMVHAGEDNSVQSTLLTGALLAMAYPERIALSVGPAQYRLASGDTASLSMDDPLSAETWLAAAHLNAGMAGGRMFLASPVSKEALASLACERDIVTWDTRRGGVVAQREWRIGNLLLDSRPLSDVPKEKVQEAILGAVPKEGLSMLDFTDDVQRLQCRVMTLRGWHPELDLPDFSTEALLAQPHSWLPLWLEGRTTVQALKKLNMVQVLFASLTYEQQMALDRLAPSHIEVPTGSRIRVDYRPGAELPVLSVRLQECFGLTDTPRVDDGRVPVLMELLSPGFKPVQLTSDLRSFWENTYFEVRKELRRRYPKHSWPDDPLQAEAVRGVKRANK